MKCKVDGRGSKKMSSKAINHLRNCWLRTWDCRLVKIPAGVFIHKMSKPKFHHQRLVPDKWVNTSTPKPRWEARLSRRRPSGETLISYGCQSVGIRTRTFSTVGFGIHLPITYSGWFNQSFWHGIVTVIWFMQNGIFFLKFSLWPWDEILQLSLWALKYKENKGLQTKALL